MPSGNGQRNSLKLPKQLERELGIQLSSGAKSGRHGGRIGERKQRRKDERAHKENVRAEQGQRPKFQSKRHIDDTDGYDFGSTEEERSEARVKSKKPEQSNNHAIQVLNRTPQPKLKSILKKRVPSPVPTDSSRSSGGRSLSPEVVLDAESKAFRESAAQDDVEVLALEKKLGLKSKRLPKSFGDDGLGDLLEGLDSDNDSKKRKRENKEWLQRKRRAVESEEEETDSDEVFNDVSSGDFGESDSGLDDDLEGQVSASPGSKDRVSDFEGFDSADEKEETAKPAPRKRENPYVAPVSTGTTKYVPPSRRAASNNDGEALQRLQRQIQGQLNKLSEANLVSILSEIEKLYQSHPRQDVTSTLINRLLDLFCDPSALQSTFVILHAAFIAAVYKVIGTDFGAELISRLVERLDEHYPGTTIGAGKEPTNLISLLSHLYTFQVIGSRLPFDYIRILLDELSEPNTELLLRIVRDTGPQLRQDDPSSLKDIVRIMQNSVAKLAASGQETSVRTRFMIDTITDLKNNKIKNTSSIGAVAIEHIRKMRKVLGSLNTRNLRASEPLRIGRADIKDTEKKGKWWLVGASWNGNGDTTNTDRIDDETLPAATDDDEADLLSLARQYRMNTSIRRSIFISIMSATDYRDAYTRLLKLRLKRAQEQEIPRVLLRCAGAETSYNPFYTLIAKKVCSGDKRMAKAFQFALWNFFKRLGEKEGLDSEDDDDDAEEEQCVEMSELVNLAKMYAGLINDGALDLSVLKTLNLAYLEPQASMFVELLLVTVLLEAKDLHAVFARTADGPGMRLFLKKVVRDTDLVAGQEEMEMVKKGCRDASKALKEVGNSAAVVD